MKDKKKIMYKVTSILSRNRDILQDLSSKGEAIIPYDVLINKGFRKDYFTNIITNEEGIELRCCFEFVFKEIAGNKVIIYTKKEELELVLYC